MRLIFFYFIKIINKRLSDTLWDSYSKVINKWQTKRKKNQSKDANIRFIWKLLILLWSIYLSLKFNLFNWWRYEESKLHLLQASALSLIILMQFNLNYLEIIRNFKWINKKIINDLNQYKLILRPFFEWNLYLD